MTELDYGLVNGRKTRRLSGEPGFKTPKVLDNAFIPCGKYMIILEAKKMRMQEKKDKKKCVPQAYLWPTCQ